MRYNLDINFLNSLVVSENLTPGLYVVSTPIGNLSDITLRSLKILSSADLILCEDTRVSKKLTNKYGIKCSMEVYQKHNSIRKIPSIISKIKNEKSIALISDAGTPTISDPGETLIDKCIELNIPIFSIPGASSIIASLIPSFLKKDSFSFLGFFPRTTKQQNIYLDRLKKSEETIIFFESPRRILKTLGLILNYIGDRKATLIREITKKHEEIINLDISNIIKELSNRDTIYGEITFCIGPAEKVKQRLEMDEKLKIIIEYLQKENVKISSIASIMSKITNFKKREIYQYLLKNKKVS